MSSVIDNEFNRCCVKDNNYIEEECLSSVPLLPIEVVIHIMDYLTYSDRIVASQVCHLWYEALLHPKFCNQEKVVIKKCPSEAFSIFKNARRPYLHFMFIEVEFSYNKMKEFWYKVAPDLNSLYFDNCDIYNRMLIDILSACSNLKSLVLHNCRELFMSGRLLDVPQDAIAVSKALQNLKELNLCANRYLSDAMFNRLISVMPSLNTISLEGCQMSYHVGLFKKYYPDRLTVDNSDYASETVLTFQNFYKIILKRAGLIKNVNLSRTLVDSSALSVISELKELQLQEIHLVGCEQLTNTGIMSLAQHQTTLTVLDVSYCSRITDQSLINVCSNLSHLQKLAVRNCRAITDLSIVHLKRLADLEDLDISQCEQVSAVGITEGLCSSINTRLLKLSMEGLNGISSETVITLAQRLPKLVHLNLSYCFNAVTDRSVQAIFQHQRLLRSLKLASCDSVTDAGLTGMGTGAMVDETEPNVSSESVDCAIISKPELYISLRSKAEEEIIQDACRKKAVQEMCETHLSEGSRIGYSLARLKGLQELDLRHCNKITDVSLKYAFRFLELQHLNLNQCQQITHVGLKAIGENNPSIDTLSLCQCYNITDEGIRALTSALHRLKYLDIKGCIQLTEVSVNAIVEHCQQLRYLDATNCNKMTNKIVELLHRLPHQTFFSRSETVLKPPVLPPPLLR